MPSGRAREREKTAKRCPDLQDRTATATAVHSNKSTSARICKIAQLQQQHYSSNKSARSLSNRDIGQPGCSPRSALLCKPSVTQSQGPRTNFDTHPKPSPENGAHAVTDAFRFFMQACYEMVESENAVIWLPSLSLGRLLGEALSTRERKCRKANFDLSFLHAGILRDGGK
jgi:hypothetical protein